MKEMLSWVQGNDVILSVFLTQKTIHGGETVEEPFDLDQCDTWSCLLFRGDKKTAVDTYSVEQGGQSELLVKLPDTLQLGTYGIDVRAVVNGTDVRSYEKYVFQIVSSNEDGNVTFEIQEGEKSCDIDMTFQLKPQVQTYGKNSYQLWREAGNEGSLQDYIDGLIETHSITPTVIEQVVQADIIGEDNYVYHYQNGRYVKTDIYCKGDKGDNLTWDDLTDEQKAEIAGVRQEVIPALKNQVLSELCKGTLSGEITLEEGVTTIDGYRFQRTNIEKLILPEGVSSIGTSAFSQCTHLVEVDFPSTLSSIGNTAFQNCHLREIILPLNLVTCNPYAFVPNSYLEYMAFPPGFSAMLFGNFDAVNTDVFKTFVYTGPNVVLYGYARVTKGLVLLYNGVSHIVGVLGYDSNVLIYVPDELYDAYQNTDDTSWTAAYKQRIRKLSTYTYEGGLDFIRRVKEKYGMTD